jgi:tetratricopeptide (TPR) repeat protein
VLQSASAIGKDVPRRLLAAAADVPEDKLRAGLGRLQERELLHEIQLDPEITYTFTHALTQEVAYAGLVRDRRHALHARIVEAIEHGPGGGAPEQLDALAHHAVRAELWDSALHYCREAGARAFTRSAHRGAAAYFQQALVALEHLPSTRERMEQAIDLRLELRHALSPLGEYRQMLDALGEAERLAENLGDQRRHGAIASFLCNAFTLRGDFAKAVEHGERAVRIATSLEDHAREAVATATLALAYYGAGQLRRAVEAGKRTIPLGDPAYPSPALSTTRLQGAGKFGMVMPPAVYGRSVAAWALADLGDFAEGRCLAAEALAIATTLDHPHSIIFASIGAGLVDLRQGEAGDALAVLERAHAVWRTADLPAVLLEFAGPLASAYAAMGRAGEAIALLEEAVAQAIALRHGFGHVLRTGGLAEAYLAAGRIEDALPLAQLYVQVARTVSLRGTEAWALRLLADVEIHREKPDAEAAMQALAAALVIAEELGMRPLAARCRLTQAALDLAGGSPGDARRAATVALAQFRALDMPRLAAQAEAMLRRS